MPKRGQRRRTRGRDYPWAHPRLGPAPAPGVAPPRALLAPWLISFKSPFSNFSGIFCKLFIPAQKQDTKCNSTENSVSSG